MKFRRQHPFQNFVLDFYCHEKKLCIEADGIMHNQEGIMEYDQDRTRLLNENGIDVLRFTNHEIVNNIEVVLHKITEHINKNETRIQ